MPTIGWFEILIIIAVAIIVVGPKDFPFMLKKIGSWVGSIKRYINDIQSEVSDLSKESIEPEIENKNNPKKDNE
jgi:sec-independent protein translocase protein TatB